MKSVAFSLVVFGLVARGVQASQPCVPEIHGGVTLVTGVGSLVAASGNVISLTLSDREDRLGGGVAGIILGGIAAGVGYAGREYSCGSTDPVSVGVGILGVVTVILSALNLTINETSASDAPDIGIDPLRASTLIPRFSRPFPADVVPYFEPLRRR